MGIALLLVTGANAPVFAAAEPDRLTTVTGLEAHRGEVAGVVGSGKQLRLQLKAAAGPHA